MKGTCGVCTLLFVESSMYCFYANKSYIYDSNNIFFQGCCDDTNEIVLAACDMSGRIYFVFIVDVDTKATRQIMLYDSEALSHRGFAIREYRGNYHAFVNLRKILLLMKPLKKFHRKRTLHVFHIYICMFKEL